MQTIPAFPAVARRAWPAPLVLRPLVVNYGLGADSTAWLLLLLSLLPRRTELGDAAVRELAGLPADTDLDDLTVITAMTGSEHPETARLVSEYMLPLLRAQGIRYVQVARASKGRKLVVLDDSDRPRVLYAAGKYRLYTEMTAAATVPTTGLARKCSIKAKGWPTDEYLEGRFGNRPFYQMMGFEYSPHERRRAKRDARDGDHRNGNGRVGVYPLIELGWDRARCLDYILQVTGAKWRKSACTFCPYRMTNYAGLTEVLAEWREWPELATEGLVMDFVSVACNEKMGLVAGRSLWEIVAADASLDEALWLAEEHLDGLRWGVYEVRRGFKAAKKSTGKPDPYQRGFTARDTVRLASGTREAMQAALEALALARGTQVDRSDPRHPRVWLRRRGEVFPTREHFLVALPVFVDEKQGNGFAGAWADGEIEPDVPRQTQVSPAKPTPIAT